VLWNLLQKALHSISFCRHQEVILLLLIYLFTFIRFPCGFGFLNLTFHESLCVLFCSVSLSSRFHHLSGVFYFLSLHSLGLQYRIRPFFYWWLRFCSPTYLENVPFPVSGSLVLVLPLPIQCERWAHGYHPSPLGSASFNEMWNSPLTLCSANQVLILVSSPSYFNH
jgi:hypothetical protein